MTNKEAEEYAKKMTYRDAINNLMKARSIPYRKATFIKVNELLNALEQEPKTGHWITKIKSDLRGDMWPTNPKCSECGGEPYYSNTIYNYDFCPFCGTRMVEPQERSE